MQPSYNMDPSQWSEIWQAVYRILEQSIVSTQLRTWIQPLEIEKIESSDNKIRVVFGAVSEFTVQWIRDQHIKTIETAFSQVTGYPCEIVLPVKEGVDSDIPDFEPPIEVRPAIPSSSSSVGAPVLLENSLDLRYTFQSFVVGASNQFAHASAVAVAEQPARQYNPLFLYSSPGLGKTHLLHAIGNHVLAKQPQFRVAYLSAEHFVNELIDCLQHHQMPQFRTKYRDSYDLIMIDDIQFIAGKAKSEEEFFHTFNALYSSKRQLIVSSDRPPKEIVGLAERVRTRFEWGLVADIQPPEIETRIAILKTKAERDDIYLPDDVATFLATHIKTNVRELEGVLIRLQAQASLTGAEISIEMAKNELKSAIPEESSHFTVEMIQNAVAKHYHLKAQDFKSSARLRSVARPRQIAMYLIRKYTGLGFKEIGHYFGGKDHTTILHACSKIEQGLDGDPSIREEVESIQNLL